MDKEKTEPFYIKQHGSFGSLTPQERREWFASCAKEASEEGGKLKRFSVDDADNPTMGLVESWEEKWVDDQGEPRWQLTLTE